MIAWKNREDSHDPDDSRPAEWHHHKAEDYRVTHDDGGGVAGVGVHVAHARDVVVESGVIIHHVLGGRLLGLASETLIIEKVLNRIRMWILEF